MPPVVHPCCNEVTLFSRYYFVFLIEEVSTPFNNWRWMCLPCKDAPAPYNQPGANLKVASYSFAVTFIIVRNFYGIYVWSRYTSNFSSLVAADAVYASDHVSQALSHFHFLVCGLSRVLNLYWTAMIVRGVLKSRNAVRRSSISE